MTKFLGDIVFQTAGHLSRNRELNRSDHANSCVLRSLKKQKQMIN